MFDSKALDQFESEVRFDWGRSAFAHYQDHTDVFVAIDVFSFSYFIDHAESDNVRAFSKLGRVESLTQPVLMGCLRNAEAVALRAQSLGKRITVVALGDELGLLGFRPNFEDLMGAGAVISHLNGQKSTQAESAEDSFKYNLSSMESMLGRCSGGKLLVSHSSDDALKFVAQLNAVNVTPGLHGRSLFT